MRWNNLITEPAAGVSQAEPLPLALPLVELPGAVTRTFDSPGFAGMTFYEIRAKSLINRVPASSRMSFGWTVNPYRGCTHQCVYCFARNTHTYLDLDAGRDFDTKVIVKVNAGELLRRELRSPRWQGESIAMGTNVDCYQRAEGRYRLMPQIIGALRDFANPFSILTKGTLILRDLPLLRQAAEVARVSVSFSVGFVDEAWPGRQLVDGQALWRSVEAGTPSPRRRLDAVRALTDAGFAVSVLMAPILPGLTDTDEAIEATVAAIARAGAADVIPLPLHLRPGAREWYLAWLSREFPVLAPRYRELFRRGSYAQKDYQREVVARVRAAARRHGMGGAGPAQARGDPGETRGGPARGGPDEARGEPAQARGGPSETRGGPGATRGGPAAAERGGVEQLSLL